MAKKGDITPQQKAILDGMLAQPENRECADCHARGPRWASVSLGVFICMRCAGIHRSLGTHITKVKSVNLDKWSEDQLQFMQTMGNAKANAIYEANLPDHYRRPNENDGFGIERFIRDKYERKAFVTIQNVPTKPKKQQAPPQQHYQQQAPPQQYHQPPPPQQQQAPMVNFDAFGAPPPAAHAAAPHSSLPMLQPPPGSAAYHHQPAPPQQQAPQQHQQTEFGAFQSAGAPKASNDFDNFFDNARPQVAANQPPPPSKDQLLSMYNRPIAPTNAPTGPNYNLNPTPQPGALQVPPGYVAVMNPMVPGGIMFVPAAQVYGGAQPGAPVAYAPPAGGFGAPAANPYAANPNPYANANPYGGGVPSGFAVAANAGAPAQPTNPNNNASFANLTSAYLGPGKR